MRRQRARHNSRPTLLTLVCAFASTVLVALVAAPPAFAFPAGAYWYSTYDIQNAWKYSKGAGVTVAVIEGGVEASLGDLRGQVLPGIDLSGHNPDVQTEPPTSTNFGHGTAMAALIAGTGKGAGLVGIAPDAKILPVDIDSPSGAAQIDQDLLPQAIRMAVDHGAKVINLSIGAAEPCPSADASAIAYAVSHDVVVVASAGDGTGTVAAPANCPGAIAVGGVDSQFKAWTQTPSGPQISFVAPAYDLVNEELNGTLSGPYPANSGTSQAAALTSGIFALIRSRYPSANLERVLQIAANNVHNGLGTGHQAQRINDTLGYGEVLPFYALSRTTPTTAPNPVWDAIEQSIGPSASSSASSSASNTSSSSAPATNAPSTSTASGSGSSGGAVRAVIIVVVVLVIVGLVVLVARQRRTRR